MKTRLLLLLCIAITFIGCKKEATLPTITTGQVQRSSSGESMICEGYCQNDGGSTVIDRGICYIEGKSTPTVSNYRVSGGSGIGAFSCNLTNLTAGTTYTYCAYATNSVGVGYGQTATFTFNPGSGTGGGGGDTGGGDTGGGDTGGGGGGGVNQAPTCNITNISNGDEFISGDAFTVEVEASDPDGSISTIRFYIDDVPIDNQIGSHASFIVSPGRLSQGIHTLKAVATDNKGEIGITEVMISYIVNYIKQGDNITKLGSANGEIIYSYQVSPSFYSSRVIRFYAEDGSLSFFIVSRTLAQLTTIDEGAWTYDGGTWSYCYSCYSLYYLFNNANYNSMNSFQVSHNGAGFTINANVNSTTSVHYEGSIPITTSTDYN